MLKTIVILCLGNRALADDTVALVQSSLTVAPATRNQTFVGRGAVDNATEKLNEGGTAAYLVSEVDEKGEHPSYSPYYVHPDAGRRPFLVCAPFKNGYSWWSRVLCEATNSLDQGKRRACSEKGHLEILDRLWRGRTNEEIAAIEQDPTLRKIRLVRNPVTRVLAAWLTWVGKRDPGEINYVESSFPDFVRKGLRTRRNPHWNNEVDVCASHTDPQYDFLKVEERESWGDTYAHLLSITEEIGRNGGLRQRHGTKCPGYGCSAAGVMLAHYTLEIFDQVAQHYSRDIQAYNYSDEVAGWRDLVANNNEPNRNQTSSSLTRRSQKYKEHLRVLDCCMLRPL
jgi:hypothetical protein